MNQKATAVMYKVFSLSQNGCFLPISKHIRRSDEPFPKKHCSCVSSRSSFTKLWNRFRPASILMVAVRSNRCLFFVSKSASTSCCFNFGGRICCALDLCRSRILIGSVSSNSGDSEPVQSLFFMTAEAVTSTQLVSSFYLKLAGSFQLLSYSSLSKNHLHPLRLPPTPHPSTDVYLGLFGLKKPADIMVRFDISLERL